MPPARVIAAGGTWLVAVLLGPSLLAVTAAASSAAASATAPLRAVGSGPAGNIAGSGGQCSSDEDCSLLGACSASTGKCICDPGWAGADCARADLLPHRPADGYINHSAASWGGRPILFGGKWNLFATEIARRCPLILFMNNSMVIRATASDAAGPYTHQEVVLPMFHHNPTAVGPTPDGYFLIFSIGTDDPEPIDCTCAH